MKKNVIMVVIDSLAYKYLNSEFSKKVSAPFLNELSEKYLSVEEMYSQAPFTEAAAMGLWCGQRTLDHKGYLRRINDAKHNIFQCFHNNGYRVFNNSIQPYCFNQKLFESVDDPYVSEFLNVAGIEHYRMTHYAQIYADGKMLQSDYDYLTELLDDFFKTYLWLLELLQENSAIVELIQPAIANHDYNTVFEQANLERQRFVQDEKKYINCLLSGENKTLYSLEKLLQTNKVSETTKKFYLKETKTLYQKIRFKYTRLNRRNNKKRNNIGLIKNLIKRPCKTSLKAYLFSVYINHASRSPLDLKQRFEKRYDAFKSANSLNTRIDHFLNWHRKVDQKQPYFAYLHVDDIHSPETFLSYDSEDLMLLKSEINSAHEVLDNLPKTYKGNVLYELGMRYVNDKLKHLYQVLEQRGALENTVLIVTSDHGYSFYHDPVRESYVKNFYLENYHIPFIVVDKNYEKTTVKGFHQSYDIFKSLCELSGIDAPMETIGQSILSNDEKKQYIMLEYLGGGCPDLTRRSIQYAIFNEELFISVEATIEQTIDEKRIKQVFDLKNDPQQLKVLLTSDKANDLVFTKLLSELQRRHEEVKKEVN